MGEGTWGGGEGYGEAAWGGTGWRHAVAGCVGVVWVCVQPHLAQELVAVSVHFYEEAAQLRLEGPRQLALSLGHRVLQYLRVARAARARPPRFGVCWQQPTADSRQPLLAI